MGLFTPEGVKVAQTHLGIKVALYSLVNGIKSDLK
jgi:hypothetical protein